MSNYPCSLSQIVDRSFDEGAVAVFLGFEEETYKNLRPFTTGNQRIMTIAITNEELQEITRLIENTHDVEINIIIEKIKEFTDNAELQIRASTSATRTIDDTIEKDQKVRTQREQALRGNMNMSIITFKNSSSLASSIDYDHDDGFEFEKTLIEDLECCICLEIVISGDKLRELPCKHLFHKTCIDKWLINKGTCAFCRKDFLKSEA
eukprot:Awhi_evm1s14095